MVLRSEYTEGAHALSVMYPGTCVCGHVCARESVHEGVQVGGGREGGGGRGPRQPRESGRRRKGRQESESRRVSRRGEGEGRGRRRRRRRRRGIAGERAGGGR